MLGILLTLLSLLTAPLIAPAHAQDNPCLGNPTAAGCTHGLPTDQYNRLLAIMTASPTPQMAPIAVDTELVHAFTFYRVIEGAQKFDAPNGNVIGAVGDGLTFVSIYGRQDGFAKMRDGTWLRLTDLEKTYASEFSGVTPKSAAIQFPMAWIVQTSLTAEYPGGPLQQQNPSIKRYSLVNIYAAVRVGDWDWFLIAPGQWIEQRKVSKFDPSLLPAEAPTSGNWVAVDLYEQVMVAYEGRIPKAISLVSTGAPPLNTNEGKFTVYQRLELTPLRGSMGEADGYSLPNVPYAMFFDGEIGFHGVYWHDGFGFRRSHGCVNLSISDAEWLFKWAAGKELTVVVWNSYNTARR
ncbi:MAG: L,D-transpeptidase [Anaerolineae bacterium]|nr:L,D-transpeptidase [Anaerolineae bacterium]